MGECLEGDTKRPEVSATHRGGGGLGRPPHMDLKLVYRLRPTKPLQTPEIFRPSKAFRGLQKTLASSKI